MASLDNTELRVRARLAWNNWPDTPQARESIAAHEARDPYSAAAWDRVIAALQEEDPVERLFNAFEEQYFK